MAWLMGWLASWPVSLSFVGAVILGVIGVSGVMNAMKRVQVALDWNGRFGIGWAHVIWNIAVAAFYVAILVCSIRLWLNVLQVFV